MNKRLAILAALCLATLALPAQAADKAAIRDRATLIQLKAIEARKAMLGLCGVTGEEAEKYLAHDREQEAKLQAALGEESKKTLADEMAKIDAGVKTSWDTTPEDARAKSCEALKTTLSADK